MGFDYGRGLTNVSAVRAPQGEGNIRYGVISQNEVLQAWCDSCEANYGSPHCPQCGTELDEDVCDGDECGCGYEIGWVGDECYGDEPLSFYIDDGEYVAESDSYGDIFITRSPYFTVCGYCSPCAPGAGYLTDRADDCCAFCFGPDFFEGEPPYPIWRVSDGSRVEV
jgi:hypothetical protein